MITAICFIMGLFVGLIIIPFIVALPVYVYRTIRDRNESDWFKDSYLDIVFEIAIID